MLVYQGAHVFRMIATLRDRILVEVLEIDVDGTDELSTLDISDNCLCNLTVVVRVD
jgi:hypothetical protein